MIQGINLIAVLGTTFFMMASATVWFSPLLFGRLWLRELRATEAEIEASRQSLVFHLGLTACSYAVALSVLAYLAVHIDDLGISTMQTAIAATCFVAALSGQTVLWENRSRVYFLINAGFYTYFIVIGLFMITYWPW